MPKVLVVDDEPDVVTFIRQVLESEQFAVVPAYDGISALDLAESESPDIILLDIMMPMMSGYEVLQQLKSNPRTQNIPVVCVSSAHTPEARARSAKAGAAMLLIKPFLPRELVVQLRRHLGETEGA